MRKEFEPCPNMFPHTNGKVLDDEIVIIPSSGPTGEPKVFEPNAWVGLPSIFMRISQLELMGSHEEESVIIQNKYHLSKH